VTEQPGYDEVEAARAYGDMVNAPLRPETIAALNERLASGDYPVTLVPRRQAADFYEDDEDPAKIRAAFEVGPHGFTVPLDRVEITYATRATTYAQALLAELGIHAPTSEAELDALIERACRLIQDAAED
jgi:hypothetical protein